MRWRLLAGGASCVVLCVALGRLRYGSTWLSFTGAAYGSDLTAARVAYEDWRAKYTPAPRGTVAGETRNEPTVGYTFVWLPDGALSLPMRTPYPVCKGAQKGQKKFIPIRGFWMGKNDVTVAEYVGCVNAGRCPDEPRARDETSISWRNACNLKHHLYDHPMNCVSWFEALAFCHWIGGGLPEVDQWRYASRSGEDVAFPWGDDPITDQRGNFMDVTFTNTLTEPLRSRFRKNFKIQLVDGWGYTSPVGTYPAGATKWGLLDMEGNVEQWAANVNDGAQRAVLGSSWYFPPEGVGGSNHYYYWDPSKWSADLGFRCAE